MSTITIAMPAVEEGRLAARREAPARPHVRLTRRGRLVVLALGLALVFGVGLWLASGSMASQESGVVQVEVVTVGHGETLWDIAADADEGGDVRDMMQRIEELNTLDSSMVYAGQELRVPLD